MTLLMFPASAWADPIIVAYSGVIETVNDPLGELPAGIGIGTPFNGSYTVDPDLYAGGAPTGFPGLVSHSVPIDFDLDAGGSSFVRSSNSVGIVDAAAGPFIEDFWLPFGATPLADGELGNSFEFSDSTDTRITDPFDFFVNTSLAGWDGAVAEIWVGDSAATSTGGQRLLAGGTITSLVVISAPPAVPVLGPLGISTLLSLLGLVGYRKLRT